MGLTKSIDAENISEDVKEIISFRPHWIVRKGNLFFLLILLGILSLTWIVKYPDVVKASARIVALNPPKLVQSKVTGKLLKLFVVNEQVVKKGQELGYTESTTDYDDVITLNKWVNKTINAIDSTGYSYVLTNKLPLLKDLGSLQSKYEEFQTQLEGTKQTLASGYYQQRKGALQKDLQYIASQKNNTVEQKKLEEKGKELFQQEYEIYEKLAELQYISKMDLNKYKSNLIIKEQSLKQADAQLTISDMSSHNKHKELLDLSKEVIDQRQIFYSSLLGLKSEIEAWLELYVFNAPEDGKVLFISSLKENEFINNGQGLFYIQPNETIYYSELMAGQQRFGKIKTGQKVMINVESYPRQEYGYLTGVIDYISNIPSRSDSFLIRVVLPKGLQTNYDQRLFFRNDLLAQAEIVTEDRRLFERLMGQLMKSASR